MNAKCNTARIPVTICSTVLVDIDSKTMNISPEAVSKAITDKTKAIVPVHVSGRGARMKEIMEMSESKNLHVVEDAAEALMSKSNGKFLGTFGKTGCFVR